MGMPNLPRAERRAQERTVPSMAPARAIYRDWRKKSLRTKGAPAPIARHRADLLCLLQHREGEAVREDEDDDGGQDGPWPISKTVFSRKRMPAFHARYLEPAHGLGLDARRAEARVDLSYRLSRRDAGGRSSRGGSARRL